MKRISALLLAIVTALGCTSCKSSPKEVEKPTMQPELSQMQAICDLAVMDCYYHNVAKYKEEDAAGALWWQKDKHFWIEYSGVVKLGVDVSAVDLEINGTEVTITLPPATVLECKVDSDSLNEDSFIVDKDSAKIEAEDETRAFADAQSDMENKAKNDDVLLTEAQQRAKALLEDYVNNIGEAIGVEYNIQWVYLDNQKGTVGESENVTEQESLTENVEQNEVA